MLHIHCSGTPYEIGLKHGREAKLQISRTIAFYTWMFHSTAQMTWPRVRDLALAFQPTLLKKWPAFLEEISGIAQGAGVDIADIIAINVRTEIAFGLFSDGCTALSWKETGSESSSSSSSSSWLAQNWDWNPRQKENVICLTISQAPKPKIKMLTEAGLIGKIGFNDSGVGVCLNAIRAKGMDPSRLPCHLGLRMVLESTSRAQAVERLEKYGVASACHMLVADAVEGGVGLEWSCMDLIKIPQNATTGQVFHSNHYLETHRGVEDTNWLSDSEFRVRRIGELCGRVGEPVTMEKLQGVFQDEANFPGSICRQAEGGSTSATLFNIVMDLGRKRAEVRVGRPVAPDESFVLEF
ncbi:acyl-coenzyme A:6-aminopenicillanic-acid-acyltransferase 40 kDa form like [Lecanosticta acicola]|uniref:Acyl-coenzyme A:6-aminopenicillanic-acid-acyltransferase 40 kDa form like n=1 Tax=Lecanosticta acicola TaxID=111012 RepID=A0AAI9EE70_9PEZI|nr:acyl-coenzyme A:6-aminopenicillanic-acid-acyltransferase 40 kDa form like [Lecanosticta acicola]